MCPRGGGSRGSSRRCRRGLGGCRSNAAPPRALQAGSIPAATPACQPSSRRRPGLAAPAQPPVPATTCLAGRAPSTAWWPPASGRRAWTFRRRAPACPRGCLRGRAGLPGGRCRAAAQRAQHAALPRRLQPPINPLRPRSPASLAPQVDLIVCYDATTSPTRSIQRMGRTGRHKEGRVSAVCRPARPPHAATPARAAKEKHARLLCGRRLGSAAAADLPTVPALCRTFMVHGTAGGLHPGGGQGGGQLLHDRGGGRAGVLAG